MAKKRGRKRKSRMGYFRSVFKEHPEWLRAKTNDVILERYREDHNMAADAKIPTKIKNSLANTKSVLREGRKGRRVKIKAEAAALIGGKKLDHLEIQIDDCLIMAHNLDPEGLERVISHLRAARNIVVWKKGQP